VYPYTALEYALYRVGVVDVTCGVLEVGAEPRAGSIRTSSRTLHLSASNRRATGLPISPVPPTTRIVFVLVVASFLGLPY
jgi:hypothetical protein